MKSAPFDAYSTAREEFTMIFPCVVNPAFTVATASPPCAPTPGISSGNVGGLIFDSVTPDGQVDPLTLHTGAPPTAGEKWVISKWFRTRPLRPPPGA